MEIVYFSEEFTELIVRWTAPSAKKENNNVQKNGLSTEQVVTAVQNVINGLFGINLQKSDYSSVKTPAMGIAVCTPTAPMVPKLSTEQDSKSLSRFRSLDTLNLNMPESDGCKFTDGNPESPTNEEKIEAMETDTLECLPDEKIFASRSTPAIHVSNINRSNTFVCEGCEQDEPVDNKTTEEKFESADNVNFEAAEDSEKSLNVILYQKLETLHNTAFTVLSQIDDLKMQVHPQTAKPIRRLSSIGSLGSRSSSMLRPTLPPKLRRSSTAFPGTPTSSKLNDKLATGKVGDSRRKSIAVIKTTQGSTSGSTNPSVTTTKKSPLPANKPTKNPKYAHVQSTISKTVTSKKKAN